MWLWPEEAAPMNFETIESLKRLAERPGTVAEGKAAKAAIKRLEKKNRVTGPKKGMRGLVVAMSVEVSGEDELDKAFDSLLNQMRNAGF